MPEEQDGVPTIADVHRKLDELTDLFRRRLFDDREKARALTTLQGELDHARDGIQRQVLEPVLRQIIAILDRLESEAPASNFTETIVGELAELLSQYGVARIVSFSRFDPSIAEAIGTEVTDDAALDGSVVRVERPAYTWSGGLIRPAAVTVRKFTPP